MWRLEPRAAAPLWLLVASPVAAVAVTLVVCGLALAAVGIDPLFAMQVYFIMPIADVYGLGELVVKATPLLLCATGLMFCFRAGIWNIGAEGQLLVGAITGALVALNLPDLSAWLLLPLMVLAGAAGGLAWAAIPALLKSRFNTNEILTSLMLVYVATLLLSALVHGPMRDPDGYNFPQSATFSAAATVPLILADTRAHAGSLLAVLVLGLAYLVHARHEVGFGVRAMGQAPAAAVLGGFSRARITWGVLLTSGALAGVAGLLEVAGPIGRLTTSVSPGYGFTAIIVAFLGRLHPVGVLFAALLLALSFIGGELAQILLKTPNAATGVFQGVLLFILLAFDLLVRYRIRRVVPGGQGG